MKFRFKTHVWGRGEYGLLGLGDTRLVEVFKTMKCQNFLLQLILMSATFVLSIHTSHMTFSNRYLPTLLNTCKEWAQIVGGDYTVALTKDGKVFTWGHNDYGKLGHGDKMSRYIPTQVKSLDRLFIVKIACSDDHTVVITDNGDIYTWYVS